MSTQFRFFKKISPLFLTIVCLIICGCAKKNDTPKAINYVQKAIDLDRQGNLTDAVTDLDLAIEANPKDANAYATRGGIYTKEKYFDLAIADFNKAVALDPHFIESYAALGLIYFNVKADYGQAAVAYTKILELNPQDKKVYSLRGLAYLMQNKYKEAVADMSRAILENQDVEQNYNNRCYAYDKLGEYDQALTDCDNAIAMTPDVADPYDTRAAVYLHKKDYDKAWIDVNKVYGLGGKPSADTLRELQQESGRSNG